MTYRQIANNIEDLNPFVFSRNRSELIAINQIGKAYQFGEYTTMRELYTAGYDIQKRWSTVHDSRVTETHRQNEADGWIPFNNTFSGTGDLMPPAKDNPRCRCANQYRVGDLR